jgi:hypothetical protein
LKDVTITNSYAKECGLVLRLWNYPTDQVIYTGLSSEDEEGTCYCHAMLSLRRGLLLMRVVSVTCLLGFFYFLHEKRDDIEHVYTECSLFNAALVMWTELSDKQRGELVEMVLNDIRIHVVQRIIWWV